MSRRLNRDGWRAGIVLAGAIGMLASASTETPSTQQITLAGSNEVPPVTTTASGTGAVTIGSDGSVKAGITVTGMTATTSHIHIGAVGKNGLAIMSLAKTGDNSFAAREGSRLEEWQYKKYKAGELYVNVYSAKYPGGEVRAQLKGE